MSDFDALPPNPGTPVTPPSVPGVGGGGGGGGGGGQSGGPVASPPSTGSPGTGQLPPGATPAQVALLSGYLPIITVAQGVEDAISAQLGAIFATIGSTANQIQAHMSQELDATLRRIGEIIQALIAPLGDLYHGLIDNLATAEDWGSSIATSAKKAVKDSAVELHGFLQRAFEDAAAAVRQPVLGGVRSIQAAVLNAIPDITAIPEPFRSSILDLQQRYGAIGALAGLLAVLPILTSVAGATASGFVANVQGDSLERHTPNKISANEAATLVRRGLLGPATFAAIGKRHGLDANQTAMLFDLTEQPLGAGDVISLARRKVIDEGDRDTRLAHLGYIPDDIPLAVKATEAQPSPQDLVTFLVREVFSPIAETYGQFEDYPGQLADTQFSRIGVDPALAKLYWAAHWDLPSPTQGFEMLHRGIINQGQLSDLLKALDIMPFWREKLIQLNYSPLTRVDVRRMHKLGVLSPDEITKAYKDLGYDQTNAERLRDFVIKLNAEESDADVEKLREPTRRAILERYEDGTIREQEARTRLNELGYSAAYVDNIIALSQYESSNRSADQIRDAIRNHYVKRVWTRNQAESALRGAGFTDDYVQFQLGLWQFPRELAELSEREKDNRDLTKAEIIGAYKERVIEAPQATSMLLAIGYDREEALLLVNVAQHQRDKAEVDAKKDYVKARLIDRRIGPVQARLELDALGMPVGQRDNLISQWELQRDARAPELSLSTITEMAVKKVIPQDELRAELFGRGYPETQIAWLLKLWGYRQEERATAEAKRTAAEQKRAEREKARLEKDLKNLTRSDTERSYIEGLITYGAALNELTTSGYDRSEAVRILALAGTVVDKRRAAQDKEEQRAIAAARRKADTEARRAATKAEREAKAAERERKVAEAKAERERKARERAEQAKLRDLSRADRVNLYKLGARSREDTIASLTNIGYDRNEAEQIVRIEDLKAALKALKEQEE